MPELDISSRVRCPCCGYPALREAAAYDICELCNWEDDGQGEASADEVWGGPNGAYSLTDARRNFRDHLVMYASGRDTRLTPGDTERTRGAKRALMAAFDRVEQASGIQLSSVLAKIERQEALLREELNRKVRDYESRDPDAPAA
jgi:cysteine-rich CPCC protein